MGQNFNHWERADTDANKEVLLKRYRVAAQCVSGTVFDLACGYGVGSSILAAQDSVDTVVGVDHDDQAVTFARAMQIPKCEFNVADLDLWGPTTGVFIAGDCDWVVSFETIEHLATPKLFVDACKRIAQVGMCVSVPIVNTVGNNPHHRHNFKPGDMAQWFYDWHQVEQTFLTERVGKEYRVLYELSVFTKKGAA